MIKKIRQDGFNLIELAVVTVVAFLLMIVIMPAVSNAVSGANLTAIGTRGRDIFVSVTGANEERESIGLSPVWPADKGFYGVADEAKNGIFDQRSSTEYFRYLWDEPHRGTEQWNPFVAGFDYSKLAGNGVPACQKGRLTPECNAWTVAKNVRADMCDMIPVLITRNIDVASLRSKLTEAEFRERLTVDPEWEESFREKALVMIRKGGAIFKARAKYMVCETVYGRAVFDANTITNGQRAAFPLKYLTPSREALPGVFEVARRNHPQNRCTVMFARVHREWKSVRKVIPLAGGFWLISYLFVGMAMCGWRKSRSQHIGLRLRDVFLLTIHYLAVSSFSVFYVRQLDLGSSGERWFSLLVALALAGIGAISFCSVYRADPRLRVWGLKWMVATPLIAAFPFFVFLALLIMAGC